MNEQKRHNPMLVTLHWLIALLILTETIIGVGFLHEMPNTAAKVAPLGIHLILGLMLLALMIVRLVIRVVSPKPHRAKTGTPILDVIGAANHIMLYVMTFLVAATGILLANHSHVLQLVVGGSVQLPMQFAPFLHAAIFVLFGLIIALHVAAALFHQFILRDRLFARMWYEPRSTKGLDRAFDSSVGS